jgi:hypothetical protein
MQTLCLYVNQPKGQVMTQHGPAVTTVLNNGQFDATQQASIKASAASFAESEDAIEQAVQIVADMARAPSHQFTYLEWTEAQATWIGGYMEAKPSITLESAERARTRFFDRVLKVYKTTRPLSPENGASKKREQRAKGLEEAIAKHQGKSPAQLEDEIKQGYAKLAAGVPDAGEVKKAVKEAETVLKEITREEVEAFKKQKAAIVSTLNDLIKKCDDMNKLLEAVKILR